MNNKFFEVMATVGMACGYIVTLLILAGFVLIFLEPNSYGHEDFWAHVILGGLGLVGALTPLWVFLDGRVDSD